MVNSSSSFSPLRQQMIDDMNMHRLGAETQSAYLRHVVELNDYLGHSPHKATAEDLRRYQLHLVQSGVSTAPCVMRASNGLQICCDSDSGRTLTVVIFTNVFGELKSYLE